ncbi:hypothetical protein D9757_011005 [Collybiopsis confluens]|uniref:Uncharacterized protein n=1 Tax=Collybiopsis confluens TaxID=2823264 RepID=A0A8H5GD78_9AGAR|nr:hypothetical protein D9757_011005 [Collybiopsis confluens]
MDEHLSTKSHPPHRSTSRDGGGGPSPSLRPPPLPHASTNYLHHPESPTPSTGHNYQLDGHYQQYSSAELEPEWPIENSPSLLSSKSPGSVSSSESCHSEGVERDHSEVVSRKIVHGSQPLRKKSSDLDLLVEAEPDWMNQDMKSLFHAVYRRHGSFKERRELNIRYKDVGCIQCAAKGRSCSIRATALQCANCPPYVKCGRVPILKRLRVTEIMKISDEQYEWLLEWYKKSVESEQLREIRHKAEELEGAVNSSGNSLSKSRTAVSSLSAGYGLRYPSHFAIPKDPGSSEVEPEASAYSHRFPPSYEKVGRVDYRSIDGASQHHAVAHSPYSTTAAPMISHHRNRRYITPAAPYYSPSPSYLFATPSRLPVPPAPPLAKGPYYRPMYYGEYSSPISSNNSALSSPNPAPVSYNTPMNEFCQSTHSESPPEQQHQVIMNQGASQNPYPVIVPNSSEYTVAPAPATSAEIYPSPNDSGSTSSDQQYPRPNINNDFDPHTQYYSPEDSKTSPPQYRQWEGSRYGSPSASASASASTFHLTKQARFPRNYEPDQAGEGYRGYYYPTSDSLLTPSLKRVARED